MGYPRRLLTEKEDVIREFRPHWRLLVIPFAWTILFVAVIIATWALAPENDIFDWVVTAAVFVAFFPLAFYPFISWWFTTYVLTSERLIRRTGVLARRGVEIPLENVVDLSFSQTILERILRSGDLLIESAGTQGQSRFKDIPDPEAFQSLVYKVREVRSRDLTSHRGTSEGDSMSKLERLADLFKEGLISEAEYESKKQALLDEI